jgi:hypothetical protein
MHETKVNDIEFSLRKAVENYVPEIDKEVGAKSPASLRPIAASQAQSIASKDVCLGRDGEQGGKDRRSDEAMASNGTGDDRQGSRWNFFGVLSDE